MVVADQNNYQADVVIAIEGTANLSPYVESLKTNYIIPTLEYFNGGPADDRDCGCDSNATLYTLVVFMAADCAPDTAAFCFGPTASTHKLLSWMDKVKFIGGAGESHSHIAEGLSTALQVFDDFQTARDSSITTQKHCILICNSPPYPLPALESSTYSGHNSDQLSGLMGERQINLSILSPRKIPPLFKIYEKAGGDLQLALGKNYAKDRRHLVLLKGFQLQERPSSPPSMDNKNVTNTSACSPTSGQKRPATNSPPNPREATGFKQPATQGNFTGMDWPGSDNQAGALASQNPAQSSLPAPVTGHSPLNSYGQPNQPMPQRPPLPNAPSHLNPLNQPNPPNVTITNKGPPQHTDGIRPPRGHSPVPTCGPRLPWSQTAAPSPPAPTPPTTSVLATQLNLGPSSMPMRHPNPMPANQAATNIVAQAQTTMNAGPNVLNAPGNLRGNLGLRLNSTSPGPVQNPLTVQLNQQFGPGGQPTQPQQNLQASLQSKMGGNQPTNSPMMPNQNTVPMPTAAQPGMPGMLQGMPQGTPQQGGQPAAVAAKDRLTIWQGVFEFQEKSNSPQQVQAQRVSHSLACTITSVVTVTGEADVNADKWPSRLTLQLIPRQLIVHANLFSILKTSAKHVIIQFSQETEALSKLCKNMSSGLVGCIQFPQGLDVRIMVVLYMPDKRIYMGFIANDQESFFNSIRNIYENYRKTQMKHRIATNMQPTEGMPIQNHNPNQPNQNIMLQENSFPPAPNTMNPATNQMNTCMPPMNQQPIPQQQNPPPPQQPQTPNAGLVHNANNPQSAARLNQLESARQQNLLKIQQLQQTLEMAQQKELQYKAAQEHQKQQHIQQQQQQVQQQQQQQQQMIERQNAIRHLQQQLQHQQQQLAQQQQSIQMQQASTQQPLTQGHNPQLRTLLQQQVQQAQQIRRQQQQQQHQMLMQQHPQGMRPQMPGNMPQGAMGGNIGQQPPPGQQNQQQTWAELNILDTLQQ